MRIIRALECLKGGGETMPKKTLGLILTVIGIIILLISLFADPLGIGGYPGLGVKQIVGIVIGVVMIVVGAVVHRKA